MKISIIIPSYGQVEYLRDAIDSALIQTYKNIEVIVVDDGSTDGSLEIAKSYGDAIRLVAQENKGLASARNAGIMNACGDYILPLDADDILMYDCVEQIVAKIKATDADVVAPSIYCKDVETGRSQATILIPMPTFEDFKGGNRLAYCAAIKYDALLEVGGYSPKMDALGGWEDLWMWYALMKRGKKIVTIQRPLVIYRIKAKSMSRDAEKNKVALWAQIVKDFPETKDHVKT